MALRLRDLRRLGVVRSIAHQDGGKSDGEGEGASTRTLYFDLDGTFLRNSKPKPALAAGELERAIRAAGFEQLVCVSSVVTSIHFLQTLGKETDGLDIILRLCDSLFLDREWFMNKTSLVSDPERRASCLDLSNDWWYVDDNAELYLRRNGLSRLSEGERARRVFMPDPQGDGSDVLDWLRHLSKRRKTRLSV